jgi:hypothetical protein
MKQIYKLTEKSIEKYVADLSHQNTGRFNPEL